MCTHTRNIYTYKERGREIYIGKILNELWFRAQGRIKRKDVKVYFESHDMISTLISTFFPEIYLKRVYLLIIRKKNQLM